MKTFMQFIENQENDEDKKVRYNQLKKEINDIIQKYPQGLLVGQEAENFKKLTKELEDIKFHLTKPLTPEKIKPQQHNTLSPEIIALAQNELIANKNIYDAILSAAHGTAYNQLTEVDKIILGTNPLISKQDLYNSFNKTRQKLKDQYGETITLYRAIGRQIKKPTTNWATTPEYAQEFGNKIISKNIPIDKIIAVNVGHNGKYHELIVEDA
jgi:hypothetical protein